MTTSEEPIRARLVRAWGARRVRLVAAGSVAVVILAGLAVWVRGEGPEDVVEAYLAAVRAGDVEAAVRIAGDPPADAPDAPDADRGFLVPAALSSDWEIGRIVRRYPHSDAEPVVVDVTLTAPDGASGEGRFQLSQESGRWRIEEPFGRLQPGPVPADFLELNGVVLPLPAEQVATFLLFPGVYRGFTSLERLMSNPFPPMVVLPGAAVTPFPPPFELNPAGHEAVQRALASHIDDCAATRVLGPAGCPFSAAEDFALEAYVGDSYYDDPADVTWEVIEYPEVLTAAGAGGFTLIDRHTGAVRITGTGVPIGEDDRRSFAAECGIELGSLTVVPTSSGEFAVNGETTPVNICRT